jgi:hypothetical protein
MNVTEEWGLCPVHSVHRELRSTIDSVLYFITIIVHRTPPELYSGSTRAAAAGAGAASELVLRSELTRSPAMPPGVYHAPPAPIRSMVIDATEDWRLPLLHRYSTS